jgi:hypothetical protein
LRATIEAHVALAAFGFQPGVALYDASGHQRGFERLRACVPAGEEGKQGERDDCDANQYMCTAITWTTALAASM